MAPHVAMLPYLAQGHFIPFIELSKMLSQQGLTVSFVTTDANATHLRQRIADAHPTIRIVSLEMPQVQGLPADVQSASDASSEDLRGLLMRAWQKLSLPFEHWLRQESPRPACIIADMFAEWVHETAKQFGIPVAVFHTSGPFGIALTHAFTGSVTPRPTANNSDETFVVDSVGFPVCLRLSEIPPDLLKQSSPLQETLDKSIAGWITLFNTFYGLDSAAIEYLEKLKHSPMLCIGPLLPSPVFDSTRVGPCVGLDNRGRETEIGEAELLHWLGKRRRDSVAYVNFGSQSSLSPAQARALACGLESSGESFLWVMRRAESSAINLPEGFEERTRERGLVVRGWAPQLTILSHPSVGAFVSHCGWNSVMESVSLGVPLVAMVVTRASDAVYNAKLLVDGFRVAVEVSAAADRLADEIARAVKMTVSGEDPSGVAMRERARGLREKARGAVAKGGSSVCDVEFFASKVRDLAHRS